MLLVFIVSWVLFEVLNHGGKLFSMEQLYNTFFKDKNITNESGSLSALGLFFNNSKAAGIIALSGIIPFLFVPLIFIIFNGALVGFIVGSIGYGFVDSLVFIAKYILPHSIFEVPAIVIGGVLGFNICLTISKLILNKKTPDDLLTELKNCVKVYFLFVVPLLILAAIIEANPPFILQLK